MALDLIRDGRQSDAVLDDTRSALDFVSDLRLE